MVDVLTDDQIAAMSDDELMSALPPEEVKFEEEQSEEESPEIKEDEGEIRDDESEVLDDGDSNLEGTSNAEDNSYEDEEEESAPGSKTEGQNPTADEEDKDSDEAKTPEADTAGEKKPGEEGFDYKAAYEKLMAPFQANGKQIKLESPEELTQLAQMGANYTKKMQALQPHLKVVKMLQNHNLLDEAKLSFLIDLDKRDPSAIQKLMKDAGIDPLDIDTSAETTYQAKDRRVSDAEYNFSSTLEEVASNPAGKEVIVTINKDWDSLSKDKLWEEPGILRVLAQQKESGIFDQIMSEVDRRKMMGQLLGVPLIQAYQEVGSDLNNQGRLKTVAQAKGENQESSSSQTQPSQRIVGTGTARRKIVSNDDKVKAVSTPKSKPGNKPGADFNPLALSDEEFEKQAALAYKF